MERCGPKTIAPEETTFLEGSRECGCQIWWHRHHSLFTAYMPPFVSPIISSLKPKKVTNHGRHYHNKRTNAPATVVVEEDACDAGGGRRLSQATNRRGKTKIKGMFCRSRCFRRQASNNASRIVENRIGPKIYELTFQEVHTFGGVHAR